MVDPERNLLSGLVEIDEASLPFRTKDDPPTTVMGAICAGRLRLVPGRRRHRGTSRPRLQSREAAANLPAYPSRTRGVYRRKHLQAYLDEFAFASTAAKPATGRSADYDRTGAMCISGFSKTNPISDKPLIWLYKSSR